MGRLIRIWWNASLPSSSASAHVEGNGAFLERGGQVRSTPSAQRRPHNGPESSLLEEQSGAGGNTHLRGRSAIPRPAAVL